MLCKICHHCGLCQGDGSFPACENTLIVTEGRYEKIIPADQKVLPNEVGISIDLGTTTLALRAYLLKTGEKVASRSAVNEGRKFGSDVIARISYASTEEKLLELHTTLINQLKKLIDQLLQETSAFLYARRIGRVHLSRICITGNTVMERIFLRRNFNGLKEFPFTKESEFGSVFPAKDFFSDTSFPDCEIFVSPTVSAFVGGDTVCAMLATGFTEKTSGKKKLLCDLGTNCELAFIDFDSDTITCTSCAAGPAFEGQGISCGMSASEGAIASVFFDENNTLHPTVIGGVEAKGLCGTGLLSSVSQMLTNDFLDAEGSFSDGKENFYLSEKVYLSQKDIRNLQLAKAAVRCGIDLLLEKTCPEKNGETEFCLVGGFGTKMNIQDAVDIGMIPEILSHSVIQSGNAALDGASVLLTDFSLREKALVLAKESKSLNLASSEKFQKKFIDAINF